MVSDKHAIKSFKQNWISIKIYHRNYVLEINAD